MRDELQSLRTRLAEAEELKRAISEGDLDALVIPGPEGEMIFTLDSADHAYRVLVETMNEGTATLADDGTILYCNRHFAELLKTPIGAVTGTSIYRFIAPENLITFKALLKHEIGRGELNLLALGGKPLPVYLSISSLKSDGSPNAWCLVATDLTEQKKSEEILASERLARSIIEQATEAIIVCDTTGRITRNSAATPRICKCDPTFQRFEDLLDVRFSQGPDAGDSILPVSSALKGSALLGVEAIFERNGGQGFYFLLNSGPLRNASGEIVGCVITLTDITQRKLIENDLIISERNLAASQEIAHVGSYSWDLEENLLIWSNELYRILGLTPRQVPPSQDTYVSFIHPDDRAEAVRKIRSTVEEGKNQPNVHRIIRSDGTARLVQINSKVLCENNGKPRIIHGIVQDITERKQAETALKQNEQRLNEILSSIQDGFFELDSDWRFTYINHRAARNGGFEPEELIGECIWEKFPYMIGSQFESVYKEVMETRLPASFEVKSLVKEQWYETSIYPSAVGISGFWRDITEHKLAEEALKESEVRFRSVLDNSQDVIYRLNLQTGRYEYFSPACKAVYGFSRAEMMAMDAQDTLNNVHPDDLPGIKTALANIHTIGHGRLEFRWLAKAGDYRWLSANLNITKDSAGRPLYRDGVARDITERKKAEEALQGARDDLEIRVKERTAELDEQRGRLQAIMDSLPVGLWVADANGKMILVNDVARDIWGGAAPYAKGIEEYGLYNAWWADTGEEIAAEDMPLARALKGETIREVAVDFERFDGTRGTQYVSASPVMDSKGNILGCVAVVQDITEHKKAEAALKVSEANFRSIFEKSQIGIVLGDLEGRVVQSNSAIESMLGYRKEELLGMAFKEFTYPDDLDIETPLVSELA
ncbi:MAG TPA: PAS domain S-box protein, partial [Methanotrichaceae archaeon]|nr:PAS domain S-box protein [Methanotrichaceae archaeon]